MTPASAHARAVAEQMLHDHLDKARDAIANAQQWADKWKAYAFEMKEALADAEQQLEVLRPGGRYAWKSQRDVLLEALKDIVDDLEARWDMRDPSTNPGIRDNVERAKAAISRAEGK